MTNSERGQVSPNPTPMFIVIGVLSLGASYIVSWALPSALMWGGNACAGDEGGIASTCGVPPVGLFLSLCLGIVAYVALIKGGTVAWNRVSNDG